MLARYTLHAVVVCPCAV